jgi:DNA repair exonuclease SbcCD ATPase subunit
MRGAALVVMIGLACGCKTKGDADAAPDPAALKAQQDLLARRDKLLQTRQQLQTDRDTLEDKVKTIEAGGGDASNEKKKIADLNNQIDNSTATELSQVNTKLDALKQTGDRSANVAGREADIATRERTLAEREARVADREKSLVQRDADLAQRWKDTCTSGPPVIIQAPVPKGGNYTKKDVSDLVARAKSAMQKKGLLVGDLPGPAQQLESEASKAINDNDMSKAYFAAAQLSSTVDSIQINRAFIQAKIGRLQDQIKSSKQDAATTQQLSSVLSDVIQRFGDGDFPGANRRLNQLAAMLR